jgi:hypothetical protein
MTEEESAPLLSWLYQHAVRPEFTCRFRWRANSIAFWDNRCVQHNAINDYHGLRGSCTELRSRASGLSKRRHKRERWSFN